MFNTYEVETFKYHSAIHGEPRNKSMRVWHPRDLPLSGCIQAGNVLEEAIKGYEEEKTRCNYSFCGVKKKYT